MFMFLFCVSIVQSGDLMFSRFGATVFSKVVLPNVTSFGRSVTS